MTVRVAAWGWQHNAWQDTYYPGDLPEDWRLGYYANEYPAVVVPAQYWGQLGFDVETWRDDVHEQFRFYIDWPLAALHTDDEWQLCVKQCQILGDTLAGILIDSADWRALDKATQQIFIDRAPDVPSRCYGDVAEDCRYPYVWQDGHRNETIQSPVALFHSRQAEPLRDFRQRLQQYIEQQQNTIDVVILADEQPDIQRLAELKTLLVLLGV